MGLKRKMALDNLKSVAMDTMIFIYMFEEHKIYLPLVATLFQKIESGKIRAVTSIVTRLEILVQPKRIGNDLLVRQYIAALDFFPNLKVVELDRKICDIASDLRARYELKTPDAIQLAAGIVEESEVFLTHDHRIQKISEIEIVRLDEVG